MISPRGFSVFLSYASEDRSDAALIAATLKSEGIEVWFDQDELRGGDEWDATIRERINDCTFFVPLVSTATQARAEGYFRREWKFAIERSEGMAEDRAFLIPVNLDALSEASARVPARFRALHWIAVPRGTSGEPLVKRLGELHDRLSRSPFELPPSRTTRFSPVAAERRGPPAWTRVALLAALLLVAAGAVWWTLAYRSSPPPASKENSLAETRAAEPSSLAVLPFANLSDDQGSDYFSDGLTEELSAVLARGPALRIVARTSAYALRGKNLTVQQIGAQLRTATLVEGSVRKLGGQITVIVHLVNVADGFRVWTGKYERSLADIFVLHAEMAKDIVGKLLPTAIRSLSPVRPMTRNMDAYDAFLRGRSFQLKTAQREHLEQAIKYFKTATDLDPNFASAWARYGEVLSRWATIGYDDAKTYRQTARDAIDRALQLDAELPEAHRALADFYNIDWINLGLAAKELQLAAKSLPNDADILSALAANSLNRGKKQEAADYILRATNLDPQNADLANNCALALDFASRYEESVAERDRAFQLGRWNNSIVQKALTYRNWKGDLGLALKTLLAVEPTPPADTDSAATYWRIRSGYEQAQGNFAAARTTLEKITRETLPTEFFYYTKSYLLAALLDAQGDPAGARPHYERALGEAIRYSESQPRRVRAHTSLALIYAGLGRFEEARASARRCLELISPDDNPYIASRTGLRVLAQVEARAGQIDAALAIVRGQSAAGFWKRHDLLLDNDWAVLRTDPRFGEIARNAPL